MLSKPTSKEFDEPQVLLSNRHGTLYNMVQAVGKTDAAYLAQIAKIVSFMNNGQKRKQANKCSTCFLIYISL